ncbi:MAG: hypothetical protein QMC65_03015 [Candidatus Poseidoniaceae archaeon]|jgi:SepF-like predicted cell division protein (DUF552 family)|tara:strand:+ start:2604 stop:3224 length:621 start_codon:yes stop_codon:yes gene_type:complete
MRRGKKGKRDEAQSSLDAFAKVHSESEESTAPEPTVPSMPDLDALARADEKIREEEENIVATKEEMKPLRTFDMPSMEMTQPRSTPSAEVIYHDLGALYPNPPILDSSMGMVLHRAVLNDITGCGQLMDWVADDHAVIVEMNRLMKKTVEFNAAIAQLNTFIDKDLGGQIIQMAETRLMLLPPGCRGVRGVEMEAFAVDAHELGRQ